MKGYAIAFTSHIRWYKPSTPPDDGATIIAILQTENTVQLQPVIYYSDAGENDDPLWVVNEGCNSGDEYETSEIIAWADDGEVAEIACKIAINAPQGGIST